MIRGGVPSAASCVCVCVSQWDALVLGFSFELLV